MVEDKPHDGCKTKLELTNQEQYLDGKKKGGGELQIAHAKMGEEILVHVGLG